MLYPRNGGGAFKLDEHGHAQRILPQPITDALGWTMFRTDNADTDYLLEYARSYFLFPKLDDREYATEKLWDAFEWIKTLEPGTDKKVRAETLLDRAAVPGSPIRHVLSEEAKTLTVIGNSFRIRDSEVT